MRISFARCIAYLWPALLIGCAAWAQGGPPAGSGAPPGAGPQVRAPDSCKCRKSITPGSATTSVCAAMRTDIWQPTPGMTRRPCR